MGGYSTWGIRRTLQEALNVARYSPWIVTNGWKKQKTLLTSILRFMSNMMTLLVKLMRCGNRMKSITGMMLKTFGKRNC